MFGLGKLFNLFRKKTNRVEIRREEFLNEMKKDDACKVYRCPRCNERLDFLKELDYMRMKLRGASDLPMFLKEDLLSEAEESFECLYGSFVRYED